MIDFTRKPNNEGTRRQEAEPRRTSRAELAEKSPPDPSRVREQT